MKITDFFDEKKKKEEGVLIAYFPLANGRYDSVELAETYAKAGVDILEIGIPVEDPYLDGQVIKNVMKCALAEHAEIEWYFEEISRIRKALPEIQMEIFTYKSTFSDEGCAEFIKKIKKMGVDCALFTDMTEEDYEEYFEQSKDIDFPMLKFLPFNAADEYIRKINEMPYGGYIFLQAADGVTGARAELTPGLDEKIRRAKQQLALPICTGFGISKPEHAREAVHMGADGIIIGSLVVSYVLRNSLEDIENMLHSYKLAITKKG